MHMKNSALAVRVISVAVVSALGLTTTVRAQTASSEPPRDSPQQMVDALHSAFGVHHARAVHAKGILLTGTFTPSAEARQLAASAVFTSGTVPITARFSDFTGIPDIPDTVGGANPRGFAIKFKLPGDASMDIVAHSFNGFPTATTSEFGYLLRAIGTSGPEAAKPTDLDQFLATHPIAKTFLTTQKPAPISYGTLAYFGVNSFKFTSASGKSQFVRYRFVPLAGEEFLDAAALKGKGPNYLSEEIAARVAKGPIVYDWYAQIAAVGDAIADPSVAWPESRQLVKLGTISISGLVPDQPAADKVTLFIPNNVPAGIEPADPMLAIRSSAYPISFAGRQ
jgi:catalase